MTTRHWIACSLAAALAFELTGCGETVYEEAPYTPRTDYGDCLEDVEPLPDHYTWFVEFRKGHDEDGFAQRITVAVQAPPFQDFDTEWNHSAIRFEHFADGTTLPHETECIRDPAQLEYVVSHHNFADLLIATGEHEYVFSPSTLDLGGGLPLYMDGAEEPVLFERTRVDLVYPLNLGREPYPF